MITDTQVRELTGTTAYAQDGDKIGRVGQVFLDDQTGQPEFVTVNTGFFGSNESFVPLGSATFEGGRLTVPFSKEKVKDAPHVSLDGEHLDAAEEERLYAYYGLAAPGTTTGHQDVLGTTGTEGHDLSGPETDQAMTRSEEHLVAGKTEQEAGRVRLRKYVTTEEEAVTVPVRKERAVVEREPITDANLDQALDGPTISEEEHEVVLHEEKPVVGTEAEPVERVRLGTEVTVHEETVTGQVRKEHVEVEGDVDEPGR